MLDAAPGPSGVGITTAIGSTTGPRRRAPHSPLDPRASYECDARPQASGATPQRRPSVPALP
ncbi:hypothetical protein [Streptomyces sp. NPDC048644]|uniref:hypothetical protein n=1 Tax=Streptomyces sp. NPDC048644 TaxID=3365582 RepID=UPI0037236667